MGAKHEIIVADYHGLSVSFTDEGWFNATAAAARYGKEPAQWLRLPGTKSYLEAFRRKYGEITYLKSRRGVGGGTWLHPKLGVRFAQWLDDDFAVWCDEQIDSLLRGTHSHFDHKHLRHEAASSYKVMSQILQEARLSEGKASAPHHFMNEAKVVNWAMTGKFEGRDRDAMSVEDLDLLAKLEVRNAVMIGRGMPYEERKTVLNVCAATWRTEQPRLGA